MDQSFPPGRAPGAKESMIKARSMRILHGSETLKVETSALVSVVRVLLHERYALPRSEESDLIMGHQKESRTNKFGGGGQPNNNNEKDCSHEASIPGFSNTKGKPKAHALPSPPARPTCLKPTLSPPLTLKQHLLP